MTSVFLLSAVHCVQDGLGRCSVGKAARTLRGSKTNGADLGGMAPCGDRLVGEELRSEVWSSRLASKRYDLESSVSGDRLLLVATVRGLAGSLGGVDVKAIAS